MDLVCVGLNHKGAPVDIREKVAFRAETMTASLQRLNSSPELRECVILSTCNRVEIYARAGGGVAPAVISKFLHDEHTLQAGTLESHLFTLTGADALRHLFRVASSLDAIVVGEPQILGQVKEAFRGAVEARTVGPLLSRVFHRAFSVAKRVRTDTAVAQSAVSVSFAAVQLARSIHGDLRRKICLLVGAGNMGELAARHFVQEGAELWVINRSYERAETLAATYGGTARAFNDLSLLLEKADVVLTSTAAPGFIITPDMIKKVTRARRYEPLFLIDIAVPRNVDPDVAKLENTYAYDVDDLTRVVDSNLGKRRAEAERAEGIVVDEVRTFEAWNRSQAVVPIIKALRGRAQSVMEAELKKTLGGLGDHLSDADRRSITAMTNAVVNKLLHDPLTALKDPNGDAAEMADLVRRLFNLPADDAAGDVSTLESEGAQAAAMAALTEADAAEAVVSEAAG